MTLSFPVFLLHNMCHCLGNDIKQIVRNVHERIPASVSASEQGAIRRICIIFAQRSDQIKNKDIECFAATIYTYTGGFDDTYQEVNLSGGWKFLTFDAAIGTYDNFDGPTLNYQFYSLTAEHKGFYGKLGMFVDDFDGAYFEAGYSGTLAVQDTDLLDYSFAVIYSDSTLLGGRSDTNLALTLSKAFDF